MRTARANALRAASRLCVLGLLAGLVGAGQITPVEAHPRDGGGGIVFISDRDSTATTVIDDVYLLDPASGITRRLTNGPDIESMPALSPDGETLAFTSIPVSEDGFLNLAGAELRTCRFHTRYGRLGCGSTRTVLPAGGYASIVATSPFSWTPDSKTLLYAGHDGPTTSTDVDVFSVDARGRRAPVDLTQELTGQPTTFDAQPHVPQSGRAFVYSASGDLVLRELDGSNPRPLTSGPRVDVVPELSPDGRRVAFQVNNTAGMDFDIYTMAAAPEGPGNVAINLTGGRTDAAGAKTQERHPSWSPDGNRIAYQYHTDWGPNAFFTGLDDSEIYSMRADGTDVRNLTDNNIGAPNPPGDILPDWGTMPRHHR
jgi:Tol biopolymer transport system component